MKFKVGDRVEIVGLANCQSLKFKIGDVGIIYAIEPSGGVYGYRLKVPNAPSYANLFSGKELKLFKEKTFTKADLKERYIVTYRNGDEDIIINNVFHPIKAGEVDYGVTRFGPNEDLTGAFMNCNYDIVAVHKPKYETIWTREDQDVINVTKEDIEKKFGCKVNIVEPTESER